MIKPIGSLLCAFLLVGSAFGAEREDHLLLEPVEHDAYGPGHHRDATGRPFTYRTKDGDRVRGDVKRDAYGPGVHMDQFGRPVRATRDLWE